MRYPDIFRALFLVVVVAEGSERSIIRSAQAGRTCALGKKMMGLYALRLRGGMADQSPAGSLQTLTDPELEAAYNREEP